MGESLILTPADYLTFAANITPKEYTPYAIWLRLSFAILSAHVPVEAATESLANLKALGDNIHLDTVKEAIEPTGLATATRSAWLMMLWRDLHDSDANRFLKYAPESWHEYRLRLASMVKGLALTKASFAACLLYPFAADICCVDVHIWRWALGSVDYTRNRRHIMLNKYLQVEEAVREAVASPLGLPLFVAQWWLWDSLRNQLETHEVLWDD